MRDFIQEALLINPLDHCAYYLRLIKELSSSHWLAIMKLL